MKKWEISRYLIDAKKTVDSMKFIAINAHALRNIDIRGRINKNQSDFYINCCAVLDHSICSGKNKRKVCSQNGIVERIYYERDKHSAHKDDDYHPRRFDSISEIADTMESEIQEVRKLCSESLPEVLTLDFFAHDRELFRMLNLVTPEKETEIMKIKHLFYNREEQSGALEDAVVHQILHDTEDLRIIENKEKLAVLMECGLNMEETLQNFQDGCIRANALYGLDVWCSVAKEEISLFKKLRELGVFDIFDRPMIPATDNDAAWNVIRSL